MEVCRSCYYRYIRNQQAVRSPVQRDIETQVKTIFWEYKQIYGSRRIVHELQDKGYDIGRYRVRSLMKKLGLKVKSAKRYKVTTNSRHNYPVAPNLLNREFNVKAPNKVWAADITYIWTLEGWYYLAAVMELHSRQIVGWAMDKRMKTELVKNALSMAFWRRKPQPGLLHHSDRGSQYASDNYQKQLKEYHMVPSMSRKGNCWDNAPMERFFRSLKSERLSFCKFYTRHEARMEILDYISFYNSSRIHSFLGYLSPMDFEMNHTLNVA